MCGIIGLLAKTEELRNSLGTLIVPMFDCMAERGPDSAGLAVFGVPVVPTKRRISLLGALKSYDWNSLRDSLRSDFDANIEFKACDNHAEAR